MEQDTKKLLTSQQVKGAGPGWHADGDNLYLRGLDQSPDGVKRRRWIVRVTRDGKKRDFGVGAVGKATLAQARKKRDDILAQLADGKDPVEEKLKAKAEAADKIAARKTFKEAAEAVIAVTTPSWKLGSSSAAAWRKSLFRDCETLLKTPVAEIGVEDIKRVVQPFWDRRKLVASRMLLNRIEMVLNYAKAHGWLKGDNPASWEVFKYLSPQRQNGGKKPHPMLRWEDVPAFMSKLRDLQGMGSLTLQMIVLTACRSNEVRGMRWDEIDWDAKLWTVPASRMKRSIPFRVPLSDQALAILKPLYDTRGREQLAFSQVPGQPISNQSLWTVVKRVTGGKATTHGFRASARTWMADRGVAEEVGESCLAHGKGDATKQAYNRADMLALRRKVMEDWGRYVSGEDAPPSDNVVPFKVAQS